MTGYEWAASNTTFCEVLSNMQRARLVDIGAVLSEVRTKLGKATWIASFLAGSPSHVHRQKSLLFASLAKQLFPQDKSIDALCYAVFARSGTLPAARHLTGSVGTSLEYNGPSLGPLSDEFSLAFNQSWSNLSGGIVLTAFQKRMESALRDSNSGIISAPTSAGKSFIVHEYVKSLITASPVRALFIVPTKALISQTAAIYRRFAADCERSVVVATSVRDNFGGADDGAIVLVLTQERCVKLLGTEIVELLDFVFIDEIQVLESSKRGALLEYVVQEVSRRARRAKFFGAGPFLTKSAELGKAVFDRESVPLETEDSPVSQMVIQVKPVARRKFLDLRVVASGDKTAELKFQVGAADVMYSRWKGSHTAAVADVLKLFGSGKSSLVYAPGPATAKNWAVNYARDLPPSSSISQTAKDLIEYVSESIHPLCSLIHCIPRKVAYHHSGIPDFVREEVEQLFVEREIDTLFCTSTLLEGVNLPAENLFVLSPKKDKQELSSFEFRNLIGRAGRLSQHLSGLVYCIQVPDSEKPDWIEGYRDAKPKTVLPTVDRDLSSNLEALISAVQENRKASDPEVPRTIRSSLILLRNRHLKSPDSIRAYVERKGLTDGLAEKLLGGIASAMTRLSIPADLAIKSPSVDPISQSQLYDEVLKGPREWIVRRGVGRSEDLERVFVALDRIFGLVDEIAPYGEGTTISPAARQAYIWSLLRVARLWIQGASFRKIVVMMLPRERQNVETLSAEEVDKAIMDAMKVVSTGITFVMSKYFSVLVEILRSVLPESDHQSQSFALMLPAMLEMGCSDARTLALITGCVPRAAAIYLVDFIPADVEDPVAWLSSNEFNGRLQGIPVMYQKILRRCGIWRGRK